MAIPVAQAGADQSFAYSASAITVTLAGDATNPAITSWKWTMLSVPVGSSANSGANQDFTDGIATIQNPQFDMDVAGCYVLQLEAENASGWSIPIADKASGQTLCFMRTQSLDLPVPGYQAYRYDPYLNTTLLALETSTAGNGQTDTVAGANGITNTGDNVDATLAPTYGSSANTICQGDDSRLSDARTPTSHASTHQSGGGDAIKLDDLAAPDDTTDLDVSTLKHGLCPKAPDEAKQVLLGTGAFGVIPDINPRVGSTVKYYIDGTAGSDVTGDGAAWGTAFATFDHVWNNVLPTILRDTCIVQFRNTGAVSDAGVNAGWHAGKMLVGPSAKFVLVGEDGYSVVSAGGTFTSGADGKSGTLSGAGWTVNEHAGKWARITAGADVGKVRGVLRNTTDTLHFNVDLDNAASGQTWEWVEPKAAVEGYFATAWAAGTPLAGGVVYAHFKHSGDWLECYGLPCGVQYGNIYNCGGTRVELIRGAASNTFSAKALQIDSTTGAEISDGVHRGGLSHDMSGTEDGVIDIDGGVILTAWGWCARGVALTDCDLWESFGGDGTTDSIRSAVTNPQNADRCLYFKSCTAHDLGSGIRNILADAESGGQDGIRALNSYLVLGAGLQADNCVDGLSLRRSKVVMAHGMAGSGNSGWGARIRAASQICIDRTVSDPAVTGTSGDATVEFGSSTWANILAGTALVDPVEFCSVYVDTDLIQESGW